MCTYITVVYTLTMSDVIHESIREARSHLAEIVDRADRGDEPTIITRRGREVAAVVPIELLHQFRRWEDEWANQLIDERMANRTPGVPLAEVLLETRAREA